MVLFSVPWSGLCDWLIASEKLPRTNVRKLSTFIGFIVPAIALVLLAFADCGHVLPVIYLCIACGIDGAMNSGYTVRHSHITENDFIRST